MRKIYGSRPGSVFDLLTLLYQCQRMRSDKCSHNDEVAKTTQDNEDVPYFMETEYPRVEIQLFGDVNYRTKCEEYSPHQEPYP